MSNVQYPANFTVLFFVQKSVDYQERSVGMLCITQSAIVKQNTAELNYNTLQSQKNCSPRSIF